MTWGGAGVLVALLLSGGSLFTAWRAFRVAKRGQDLQLEVHHVEWVVEWDTVRWVLWAENIGADEAHDVRLWADIVEHPTRFEAKSKSVRPRERIELDLSEPAEEERVRTEADNEETRLYARSVPALNLSHGVRWRTAMGAPRDAPVEGEYAPLETE